MQKIELRDVWGRAAWNRILEEDQTPPSEKFKETLDSIWRSGYSHDVGRNLSMDVWDEKGEGLLRVVNPNNRIEAYLVCNLIKHIEEPLAVGQDIDMTENPNAFFSGYRYRAFQKVLERFSDTVLGSYANFVNNPPRECMGSSGHLVFNNTYG
jgi:hypothetical protein